MSAPHPAFATAAPAIAADQRVRRADVGSPKYHVMMSQAMAPISPAKITALSKTPG